MTFTLSTGHTVHLRDQYTHRMECAFKEALTKGMQLRESGGEVIVNDIKADALDRAVEAVFALLVDKIEKNGEPVPYSTDWLMDLPEKDFLHIKRKVDDIRSENEDKKALGKKNQ